jgi:CCR4-NOT transcription complex subunit 9
MFQQPLPPSSHQQQQQQQQQQAPSASSNDGIFWSPAPPHPVQPTSILQRPQQLPPQQPPISMNPNAPTSLVNNMEFAGDYSQIFEWVSQLLKGPEGREKALLELSRKREQYDDLALILWHSFGIYLPVGCF